MSELKIIPLGGMGRVTQNMYLYEYDQEIMIVDCGIGFPDVQMFGVDIILPDISYLLKEIAAGKKIVGMVLSHGHDDHIAATGYLLPELPDFPIYASPLTAGFAELRMRDGGAEREITVMSDGQVYQLGENFSVEGLAVTHSVPDTKHLIIKVPGSTVYHGTDFKLDDAPVDGVKTDLERIKRVGVEGVDLALLDCLRVEREERIPSESTTGPVIEEAIASTQGKSIATMMSSHIHRIQQTVDAAIQNGRKVAFIGRSVEQNVQVALELGKLDIPPGSLIDKNDLDQYPDRELCIIIAGSQGQEGSSLVRAVFGEHRQISIHDQDKVIFSADAIPGNEVPFYRAIDELSHNRVEVIYPAVTPNLHQSGHASADEQREVLGLLKPKFVMPIGGSDRHRVRFVSRVAQEVGLEENQVLLPDTGEIVHLVSGVARIKDKVEINPQTVDGLGIGDVGPQVLADRKALSESGMIVIVIPKRNNKLRLREMKVISRGFVFMKEADEVVAYIKERTAEIIGSMGKKAKEAEMRTAVEKRLGRSLNKIIRRQPMIVTVVVNL